MADRLSLRLVRPSKMDEPQSEKLSGATGQPRTPRPIYSPAPFVLQDAGGFCTLGKREGESHLSPARSGMNVFTCYCVTARDGSREHRHDNLEWRKKLSEDVNATRAIHILCETQRSDFLRANEMRVSDIYYQLLDYDGVEEANKET